MESSNKYQISFLTASDPLEEWDKFVEYSPQGNIFCYSWWLRAVCADGFKILILKKGGRVVAGMPIPISGLWGYREINMPKQTQTLGILLAPATSNNYEKKLSKEMEIISACVESIPKFHFFSMNFNYNFTNWLPFFWAGFKQTTRYTYIITDLTDLDKVFSEFAHSKRKNIKKAQKLVRVGTDLSAEEFYANHILTLKKQGDRIKYNFDQFKGIYEASYKNNAGKTWYALDKNGALHAAVFIVFDTKSAYYLISIIDPEHRNSGAATLLIKNAIEYVSKFTSKFDFEGSMIRGVENSFRKFGAVQTPFFHITKDNRSMSQQFFIDGIKKISFGLKRLKKFKLKSLNLNF